MPAIILIASSVFLGDAMTRNMYWAEKHPGRVPVRIWGEVFHCLYCRAKLRFEGEK